MGRFKFILLFFLLSTITYSQDKLMVEKKPFNIDIIGNVELKGGKYIYVSFYDSYNIKNIGLKIKSNLPEISSYTYKGVKYDPKEFGFSFFQPDVVNSISVKSSIPYFKESEKFNSSKIFSPTGHLYIYYRKGDTQSDSEFLDVHREIIRSSFSGIELSDNIKLDYTGIERIIENQLLEQKKRKEEDLEFEEAAKEIDHSKKVELFFKKEEADTKSSNSKKGDFWEKDKISNSSSNSSSEQFWNSKVNENGDGFYKSSSNSKGFLITSLNGKYGVVDAENNIIIPFKYDEIISFKNNMAKIKDVEIKDYLELDGGFCKDPVIEVGEIRIVDNMGNTLLIVGKYYEINGFGGTRIGFGDIDYKKEASKCREEFNMRYNSYLSKLNSNGYIQRR